LEDDDGEEGCRGDAEGRMERREGPKRAARVND
jgi:hypothetical protein